MVKSKEHDLLDVFPGRINQKVADKTEILNVGRTTRSSKVKTLYTTCPYANKPVSFEPPKPSPKPRHSYSPGARTNLTLPSDIGSITPKNNAQRATSVFTASARAASVLPKAIVSNRFRAPAPTARVISLQTSTPVPATVATPPSTILLSPATSISDPPSPQDVHVAHSPTRNSVGGSSKETKKNDKSVAKKVPVSPKTTSVAPKALTGKRPRARATREHTSSTKETPSPKRVRWVPTTPSTTPGGPMFSSAVGSPPSPKVEFPEPFVTNHQGATPSQPETSLKIQILSPEPEQVSEAVNISTSAVSPAKSEARRRTLQARKPSSAENIKAGTPQRSFSVISKPSPVSINPLGLRCASVATPASQKKEAKASRKTPAPQKRKQELKKKVPASRTKPYIATGKQKKDLEMVMINPVFTSTKDYTFKEVDFDSKCATSQSTIDMIVKERLRKEEEAKKRASVIVDVASLYKSHSHPVIVNGRIAIEYDNFDLTDSCRFIKSLACFHEKHDNFIMPLLKLVDRETVESITEGNVESFYKEEIIPAIDNLEKFKNNPTDFHDVNRGKYERYLEDGLIIEYPLPPKPEVFPFQIRKRTVLKIFEEVTRQNEESARRDEEAARVFDAAMEEQQRAAANAHIQNHLDNLAAFHHQHMMRQMFAPPPPPPPSQFLYQAHPHHHPQAPMFLNPHNNMFLPGMHFQPAQNQYEEFFNNLNVFQMHHFDPQ